MRKYALVNQSVITSIIEIEEEALSSYIKSNEMVLDITDLSPQPLIHWVLNGNTFEIPQGITDREQFELELASKKTDFGIKLARIAVDRIGAKNKILNKTGDQVATLLNQMLPVKLLLETGALGTARFSCTQLKLIFTEYTDVFDFIINEINLFEQSFGL